MLLLKDSKVSYMNNDTQVDVFYAPLPPGMDTKKPVGIVYNDDQGKLVIVMGQTIRQCLQVPHSEIEKALEAYESIQG